MLSQGLPGARALDKPPEEGALGGPQLRASHWSPAARPAALQEGFPLSEPRMTSRTIYLAIRVVKNTLSDTRSKVTGRRPRGEGTPGPLPGTRREAGRWPPTGVAFAPLQLCGRRLASSGIASCWKSWLPATSEQGWQRARPRDAVPSEGSQVWPWTQDRPSPSRFGQSRSTAQGFCKDLYRAKRSLDKPLRDTPPPSR